MVDSRSKVSAIALVAVGYATADEAMDHEPQRIAGATLRPHGQLVQWRNCLAAVETP